MCMFANMRWVTSLLFVYFVLSLVSLKSFVVLCCSQLPNGRYRWPLPLCSLIDGHTSHRHCSLLRCRFDFHFLSGKNSDFDISGQSVIRNHRRFTLLTHTIFRHLMAQRTFIGCTHTHTLLILTHDVHITQSAIKRPESASIKIADEHKNQI